MSSNSGDPVALAATFWDAANDGVAVACSAGPDSLAALVLLASSERRCSRTLMAFHIDHGWRGAAAAAIDAEVVRGVASRLRVEVQTAPSRPPSEGSPEMRARVGRYLALTELCAEFRIHDLVTAHHADDQVETQLLAILRQSRPSALIGIRASRELAPGVLLRRPFLTCSRESLRRFAPKEALHDPTNDNVHLARNALRHHVLSELRGASELPSALTQLARVAERVQAFAISESNSQPCARVIDEGLLEIDVPVWIALSPLARDAELEHATSADTNFPRWTPRRRQLIDNAVGIATSSGARGAPRGERIIIDGSHLYFDVMRLQAEPDLSRNEVSLIYRWGRRVLRMSTPRDARTVDSMELTSLTKGLRLSSGERLVDALRRHRVPAVWRQRIPYLLIGGRVAWFPGMRPQESTEPSATVSVIEGPNWPVWPTA